MTDETTWRYLLVVIDRTTQADITYTITTYPEHT